MTHRWSIVAVVSNAEHILAVARGFDPRDVNLPGDSDVLEDVSPVHTLRRMVREKTGVRVLAYHRMAEWQGEHDEPVYAFFVTQWSGKPRTGTSGKAFWALPRQLIGANSTFADDNRKLLKQLMRVT